MLRQVSSGNIVYSELRKHFVRVAKEHDSSSNQSPVNPEEYSNARGKFRF